MAKVSLTGMTRKELEKLQQRIATALEKLNDQDRKAALAAAKKAAAAHGVSWEELTGGEAPKKRGPKPGKAKTVSVAKYANPADKTQTWTGKGRKPEWFKAAIAKGTDPKAMEI